MWETYCPGKTIGSMFFLMNGLCSTTVRAETVPARRAAVAEERILVRQRVVPTCDSDLSIPFQTKPSPAVGGHGRRIYASFFDRSAVGCVVVARGRLIWG